LTVETVVILVLVSIWIVTGDLRLFYLAGDWNSIIFAIDLVILLIAIIRVT
jgi:hypothetical protein